MKKLVFLIAILTVLTSCSNKSYYEVNGKVVEVKNRLDISEKLYQKAIKNPGEIYWKTKLESIDSTTVNSWHSIELHGEILGIYYNGNEVPIIKRKEKDHIEKFLLVLHLFLTGSMILLLAVFILTGKKWVLNATWTSLLGIFILWIYFGAKSNLIIFFPLFFMFCLSINIATLERKFDNKNPEEGPEKFFFKHTGLLLVIIYLFIIVLGTYPYIM